MKLTVKQYETLVKMAYLANWMIEETVEDPNNEYAEFEQFILSQAKDYGFEKNIETDEESKLMYVNEDFEEKSGVFDILDDYEIDIVSNTLSAHFAEIEVEKKFPDIDEETYEKKVDEITEQYLEKFAEKGLDIVSIK